MHILMMKILVYLLNIILMFLMTKGTTQNLFNIILNYSGITWLKVGMFHNGMLFG